MKTRTWKTFHGFTLIELLVAFVIIGILIAIAWPQFIFAIERSRAASVLTTMHHLQNALDDQILQGLNERHLDYIGGNELGRKLLLTTVNCKLSSADEDYQRCFADNFSFRVWCSELGCFISAVRGPLRNDDYALLLRKVLTNWNNYPIGVWDKDCMAHSDRGYKICKSLEQSGWATSDERYEELIKNLNM